MRNLAEERKERTTIPVRLDLRLYRAVAIMAEREHRKVRAQIEVLIAEGLEARRKLETRGGRP